MLGKLVSLISLRSLVIAGFSLTILPCVLAVLFSVLALDELSGVSKGTAYRVAQVSENRQLLRKRLVDMERRGKQYLILKDPVTLDTFIQTHRQVKELVRDLRFPSNVPEYGAKLDEVDRIADRLLTAVTGINVPQPDDPNGQSSSGGAIPVTGMNGRMTDDLFDQLNNEAEDLGRVSSRVIDEMVAALKEKTGAVQGRILFRTSVLIPTSLLLISVFIYLITHPIRQLDQGIRQIGTGNLRDPIEVSGPMDLRYLGQRLEWLRDQLTALEQAKQRFVRNVSHELKTPLANIHEGATLLADQVVGEINAEQQGIVEIMLGNSHRLEHLISELIHYGSANLRRDTAKMERVDLREMVRSVVKDYELRLRAKSITLSEDLHPAVMAGNREQLRLIIDNLLSNAVKYTPEQGGIGVSLAERGGYVDFMVQDDGPGVHPEDRSMIFEPFYRAPFGRQSGVKGSGLGLAIVRECVSNYQGKVEVVDPLPGRSGACFRVRLPVDPYA